MIESIEVINIQSGAKKTLRVGRYVKNSFLVRWPMAESIEIRRNSEGQLVSQPRSFFQRWKLEKHSADALQAAITERQQQIKEMIAKERVP